MQNWLKKKEIGQFRFEKMRLVKFEVTHTESISENAEPLQPADPVTQSVHIDEQSSKDLSRINDEIIYHLDDG